MPFQMMYFIAHHLHLSFIIIPHFIVFVNIASDISPVYGLLLTMLGRKRAEKKEPLRGSSERTLCKRVRPMPTPKALVQNPQLHAERAVCQKTPYPRLHAHIEVNNLAGSLRIWFDQQARPPDARWCAAPGAPAVQEQS